MMLAETVSLDGDLLMVILVLLIVLSAAALGVMALGCVLAVKAAKGSGNAHGGWLAIATIEALIALSFVPGLFRGRVHPFLVICGAALAVQVSLFFATKSSRR